MRLICCCLSQVFFFIKKLVSPDHHVEVQQHRSGLPTQHTHTRPTHPTHPPTHPPRKRRRGKKRRGKGTRTTPHPAPQHIHSQPKLIPRTTPTPHTKGKREKGMGKGGPFVCGLGTMCGMNVGYKRICYGAGEMWCSAGEEKRKREVKEVKEERRERHYSTLKKKGKRAYIYTKFLVIGTSFCSVYYDINHRCYSDITHTYSI